MAMKVSRAWVPPAALAAIWAVSVMITWRIVENPFYDFAHALSASERWAQGLTIYRDFQIGYPPLTFWLYGSVMRLFPKSYAAVQCVSVASSLLFLIGCYKLARLLLGRSTSLVAAACSYLATFVITSVSGQNIVTVGLVYTGLTLFNWFVWFTARAMLADRRQLLYAAAAGLLGAGCLLSKHERAAGVAAVVCFLILHLLLAARKKSLFSALWPLVTVLVLAGVGGYSLSAWESGWFYLSQSMTHYGMAGSFAKQDFPTLTHLVTQLSLLFCHAAILLGVAAAAARAVKPAPSARPFSTLLVASAILLALGILIMAAEIAGVAILAKRMNLHTSDLSSVKSLTQSIMLFAFSSRRDSVVLTALNYAGTTVLSNILPAFSVILILGLVFLMSYFRRPGRRGSFAIPIRLAWVGLLLAATAGTQIRWLLRRTEFGTLSLLFPVFFYMAGRAMPSLARLRPSPAFTKAAMRAFTAVWAFGLMAAAATVYLYEFGNARVNPIRVETDKGTILFPRGPQEEAFAKLVEFVQHSGLAHETIVCVPFNGPEYWIGGKPTPLSWCGLLQPEFYHLPWSSNLVDRLQSNNIVFIEDPRLEHAIQATAPGPAFSWIDGPEYRISRWKEEFPELWAHIANNTTNIASFGPADVPRFRLWIPKSWQPPAGRHTPE